jgi:hypothetical protein
MRRSCKTAVVVGDGFRLPRALRLIGVLCVTRMVQLALRLSGRGVVGRGTAPLADGK